MRAIQDQRGVSGAVYAVLLIAVLVGALFWTGVITLETAPSEVTTTVKPPAAGPYKGPLDVKQKAYDGFDVATTYTHGTNYNNYWFVNRDGWIQLGSGDTTIEATEDDSGYIYVMVDIPSGQNYYVDHAQIQSKNSRVQSVTYQDITNDGNKDFVFKSYIGDVPIPASGNPQWTFYPYLRAYQKPTINDLTSKTGIGTAATTQWAEWYLSFSNTKKSFQVTKVVIGYNSTDVTKLDLNGVNIPGLGMVSGSQFAYEKLACSIEYTYTVGSDLSNGLWLNYGTNQLNKFPFDTKVTTHFTSGDQIGLTITIYGLTPTGTLTTITDTYGLQA